MARILYNKNSTVPFSLSRTKVEDFIKCRRCFYLDVKMGLSKPSWPPFTLNNAVDNLLKKEFDTHRAKGTSHPLMKYYGLKAIPFAHEKMNDWQNYRKGIRYYDEETNLELYGAIDDLWIGEDGKLIVVDYKATSINGEVSLEGEYREAYKRQVEFYQWLFRKNGYDVSNTAYFVYVNALKDKEAFDGQLEFKVKLLPYEGSDSWVEPTIKEIKRVLDSDKIPEPNPNCEYCNYRAKAAKIENMAYETSNSKEKNDNDYKFNKGQLF